METNKTKQKNLTYLIHLARGRDASVVRALQINARTRLHKSPRERNIFICVKHVLPSQLWMLSFLLRHSSGAPVAPIRGCCRCTAVKKKKTALRAWVWPSNGRLLVTTPRAPAVYLNRHASLALFLNVATRRAGWVEGGLQHIWRKNRQKKKKKNGFTVDLILWCTGPLSESTGEGGSPMMASFLT